MKINSVYGSPKLDNNRCLSLKIISRFAKIAHEKIETYQAARLVKTETDSETLNAILDADALLIVFPLYVDSMPAPLIELLTRLERAAQNRTDKPTVYAICNCGYFDSVHTETALEMVEMFAKRAGLPWGYGIGIGGGPALSGFGGDWSQGPSANVYFALSYLYEAVKERKSGENILLDPKLPRFIYMAVANLGWRMDARKNKTKKLRAKPYNS